MLMLVLGRFLPERALSWRIGRFGLPISAASLLNVEGVPWQTFFGVDSPELPRI